MADDFGGGTVEMGSVDITDNSSQSGEWKARAWYGNTHADSNAQSVSGDGGTSSWDASAYSDVWKVEVWFRADSSTPWNQAPDVVTQGTYLTGVNATVETNGSVTVEPTIQAPPAQQAGM